VGQELVTQFLRVVCLFLDGHFDKVEISFFFSIHPIIDNIEGNMEETRVKDKGETLKAYCLL
jgi:hypothetical protein